MYIKEKSHQYFCVLSIKRQLEVNNLQIVILFLVQLLLSWPEQILSYAFRACPSGVFHHGAQ